MLTPPLRLIQGRITRSSTISSSRSSTVFSPRATSPLPPRSLPAPCVPGAARSVSAQSIAFGPTLPPLPPPPLSAPLRPATSSP
eukprot:132658-Pyramimonas_sp.AAC.1